MEITEITVSYETKADKPLIKSSTVAYDIILNGWNKDLIEVQEEMKILYLNRANALIGIHHLSKGGIHATIVDARIILGIALKCLATSLILVHNHPSGNITPSQNDKDLTENIKNAAQMFGIQVMDHLIISRHSYFSFADEGLLK